MALQGPMTRAGWTSHCRNSCDAIAALTPAHTRDLRGREEEEEEEEKEEEEEEEDDQDRGQNKRRDRKNTVTKTTTILRSSQSQITITWKDEEHENVLWNLVFADNPGSQTSIKQIHHEPFSTGIRFLWGSLFMPVCGGVYRCN